MQEIYDNGGRKFLFLNVPPTNRTPMFIDQGNETTAEVASYLEVYNRNLKSMVEGWARERGDVSSSSSSSSSSPFFTFRCSCFLERGGE